jgi:hypothetical protein
MIPSSCLMIVLLVISLAWSARAQLYDMDRLFYMNVSGHVPIAYLPAAFGGAVRDGSPATLMFPPTGNELACDPLINGNGISYVDKWLLVRRGISWWHCSRH